HYTVSKYLDDLNTRFGGIDAVLLWHSYPNIGIDERNQFQMLQSLPGFPDQVIRMIEEFHLYGVDVLIPFKSTAYSVYQYQHRHQFHLFTCQHSVPFKPRIWFLAPLSLSVAVISADSD